MDLINISDNLECVYTEASSIFLSTVSQIVVSLFLSWRKWQNPQMRFLSFLGPDLPVIVELDAADIGVPN